LSLGFVIVLERDIDGVEPRNLDGRTLASKRHTLDSLAHEHDLPGLGEFVAFSQQEAEALAEDMRFDAPTVGHQSGRWFPSADGLEVVRAILTSLNEDAEDVEDAGAIVTQLEFMETVLAAAEGQGVRFRLSLDY
jgi:hypothetical protein